MLSRSINQGCCDWHLGCGQARRERVAKNDERSRDVFREFGCLKARVELESAHKTAEEFARREAGKRVAGGEARSKDEAAGGNRKRSRRRPRPLAAGPEKDTHPLRRHEENTPRLTLSDSVQRRETAGCGGGGVEQRSEDVKSNGKEKGVRMGRDRCCRGGGEGAIDLLNEHGGPPAELPAKKIVGLQRRECGEKNMQQQQQQQHEQTEAFAPAVLALRRQEWAASGSGEVGAATAATHVLPSGVHSLEGQERQELQAPFVVVGMLGEFCDRVLLLPTTKERRQAMGLVARVAVPLTWTDSRGFHHSVTLTRTKAKPAVCNPLLMLATLLSWMREFSPGVLPEGRCPLLPEAMLTPQLALPKAANSTLKTETTINNNGRGTNAIENQETLSSTSGDPGIELSIGAAWLMAHLLFGRDAGGKQQRIFTGAPVPSSGRVGLFGGEAAVLALLPCPLIGWCPRPQEVMEALSEGGGSLCSYSVSPSEFKVEVAEDSGVKGASPNIVKQKRSSGSKDVAVKEHEASGGREQQARAAAYELVQAGFANESAGGVLTLAADMENTCELVLKIFLDKSWEPDRDTMARISLGLTKTGPMATGMCPPDMSILFAAQRPRRGPIGSVSQGNSNMQGIGDRSESTGRMRGLVGDLCIKLHSWCYETLRPLGGRRDVDLKILKGLLKNETEGHSASPFIWSGPMAQVLLLLGGATAVSKNSSNARGTVSNGDGGDWMAALSRKQRMREAACLRLKDAASLVVGVIGSLVGGLQKLKDFELSVMLLRLMVRSDQGLAGAEYIEAAPDLTWAADWVTSKHRGYAYTRLAINLKNLKQPGRRQLEAVTEACEDDGVLGGERVELRERYRALHKQFGDSQDSPMKGKRFCDKEETLVVRMATHKEGNRRSNKGGRKLYFDLGEGEQRWSEKNSLNVEEVLLRERYRSGGWLGVHCEYLLNMFLVVLLLWEEVFDVRAEAAVPHVITNRPLDLQDKFFWNRREGLPSRLLEIARSSDEQLWLDVGQRYDRFRGVVAVWCDWGRFPKQQVMEICVAFGGRRLSELLRATTTNMPHLHFGFPDVVLWRPRRTKGTGSGAVDESGLDWRTKSHSGLGWKGYGEGWEVEVVEVKSKDDVISNVQKAWLIELQNARVPAMVTRVLAEKEAASILSK